MNERGSLLESPYPSQFSDFPKKSQNILKPSGIFWNIVEQSKNMPDLLGTIKEVPRNS
jgi:hypothetical protein